ncbi:putative response regulator [Pseudoalteromonas luteoviolacea B = ATCC 29581]|nr:putative response regulator [Pseudoalteromonas luteoviolacea B = ATCC 29581]
MGLEKEMATAMPVQNATRKVPHILVVDDEYFNFEMLSAALSDGFVLSYANSGKSCLSSAIANPPDAILLDVCMPGLDGYDTCRMLKNTPETKDIPVVMVSGLETEQEQRAGFEAGCDAYVVKPFSMQSLLEKIKKVV